MCEKKREVYVIGHKNPDTDSICSAIAYAHLKNEIGEDHYIAARAGQLNEETQFVLKRFKVDPPQLLNNVQTQVKDIDYRKTPGVTKDISLKKAWNMMQDQHIITLPVTQGEVLEGLITVGDIATAYMDVSDSGILAKANTTYGNIIETLNGTLCVGEATKAIQNGKVLIAAANPDLMEDYIKQHDLVILGNRYESQLCAIEMKADAIIVCEGAKISRTIIKLAQENNCTVIGTPYDTFTVARLLNQSMPIEYFMRSEGLVTFQLEDTIDSIKEVMAKKRHRYFPIVDEMGNYAGMISRRNFLDTKPKCIIMVDHNEKSQAVEGIDDANILEIIDHHRLGSMETISPVFFRNQPLGCTATIIYQMYLEKGVSITKKIAGLLCAAILSDTLMYRSPTCTKIDRETGEILAKIAGIEAEELADNMFTAGSELKEKTTEEIFNQDLKKFSMNSTTFAVGQISVMLDSEIEELKKRILPYMKQRLKNSKVNMVYFMLTNISKESTELLFAGSGAREILEDAFDEIPGEDSVLLPGVISRKKQLIPYIMKVMNQ